MRKCFLVLLTAYSLCGACKHPIGAHFSQEEMAPILADLHLADAYSGMLRDSLQLQSGKNYDSLAIWTKAILAKHKTTQTEFNSNMDWYRDHPVELDSLYAKVIPILEKNKK